MTILDNYDWGNLEAKARVSLREPRTAPVPDAIVRQAQRSYEGVAHPQDPDRLMHVLTYEFPTEEHAAAFAAHMKNAGAHTTPATSVTVVIDPDRTKTRETRDDGTTETVLGPPVNPRVVAWRASERRGRRPSQ